MNKIWWITGNSGAGKTSLSKKFHNVVRLDGDEMREVWKLGFSEKDRWEQNIRIAKLARIINEQGFDVVVSTICPYKKLRREVKKLCGCRFIYLEEGVKSSKKYPYER